VLYTTARLTDKTAALVRARVGNLNLREVDGMLNVPVSDAVMLRAAFDVIERDGYIENLLNGDDLGEIRRKSGRLSLTIRRTTISRTGLSSSTPTWAAPIRAPRTRTACTARQTNNGFALTAGSGFLFSPALDFAFGPEPGRRMWQRIQRHTPPVCRVCR
jgi:iron complex outermembrane receptor protein